MLRPSVVLLVTLGAFGGPLPALAQPFENLGARALGMAGAFVAVADDASAVRWNPAGLAAGPMFNVMVERAVRRREPPTFEAGSAVDQSVTGFAITTLPLGLSYYRQRYTTAEGAAAAGAAGGGPLQARVSSLVTHHTGVTLLHSLTPALIVSGTLKFVRGIAMAETITASSPDEALGEAIDLLGQATNRFDADVGVMFLTGPLRAGVTVRNVTEPSFAALSGEELGLEREARAGVAWIVREATTLALDVDLTRPTVDRTERQVAIGVEQRLLPHAAFRGGVRFAGAGERDPVVALGASVAVRSGIWIDGFWNGGEDDDRMWGLAARVEY